MDNVAINIDGVLYLRVMDPYKVKVDEISEVNSSINTYVAGKLWDWRPWVRHHPVGSNNHEERNRKNQSRHAFQGKKSVFVYKMMIIMTTPTEETKENLTMPSMQERENLNIQIVRAINAASEAWGIQSMRWGSGDDSYLLWYDAPTSFTFLPP